MAASDARQFLNDVEKKVWTAADTPGPYLGAEKVEDDCVPFAEKMEGLIRELSHSTSRVRKRKQQTHQRFRRVTPVFQHLVRSEVGNVRHH